MAKSSTMSRQAGRTASGSSALATLAGRATTESATAGQTAGLNTGNNFTGQYLYDTFINDGEKFEATKMDVVRAMVKAVDTQSFKKLLSDFVGVAQGYLKNAEDTAKQGGVYNKDNPTPAIMNAAAKLKTARNVQTVMRTAYGALKHASAEVAALGGGDSTGYTLMLAIGKKALATKGINWDGTKAEAPEARNARLEQTAETKVMLEIQQTNPRKDGEERTAYLDRVLKLTDKAMKAKRDEAHADMVLALAKKARDLLGPLYDEVMDALLAGADQLDTSPSDPSLH